MTRKSPEAITAELEGVWVMYENEIKTFFRENPTAIKMRRSRTTGGLPCSVIKDPDSGNLFLMANKQSSEAFRGQIGKANYALDVTAKPRQLCMMKVVKGSSLPGGHNFTEEHKIARRMGITKTTSIITRTPHASDVGQEEKHYLLLTYLGQSLKSVLEEYKSEAADRRTPGNLHERFHIAQLVLQAIKAFHDQGFMHNDLHSGNVTLERDASGRFVRAHLIDFGRSSENDNPAIVKYDYQNILCDIFPIYFDGRIDEEWAPLFTVKESKAIFSNHAGQVAWLCKHGFKSPDHFMHEDRQLLEASVAAAELLRTADPLVVGSQLSAASRQAQGAAAAESASAPDAAAPAVSAVRPASETTSVPLSAPAILEALNKLKLKALSVTPSEDTRKNIGFIINRCNDVFHNQSIYGNAALNRKMLLDEALSQWLTPEVIQCIFSQSHGEEFKITRGRTEILLRDAIYHGFSDGLKTLKYMPNNELDYSPASYAKQQDDFDRCTSAIIQNIAIASGVVCASSTLEEFRPQRMVDCFKKISTTIAKIRESGQSGELLRVPGYPLDIMRNQVLGGLKDACRLMGITPDISILKKPVVVNKNFSDFCETFLGSENVVLNGDVSHMFYDRAHLEAAIEQNTKIKFNDCECTFQEIFAEMIKRVSENPERYSQAVKEQLELRIELVENDLRKRFPKEAGLPITDNVVVAVTQIGEDSFDVVGLNNANKERVLHVTCDGRVENRHADKVLGTVHKQMGGKLNEIFNHFAIDISPELKIIFALREAITEYDTQIAVASNARFRLWKSSNDSKQMIDALKQILEKNELPARKVEAIRAALNSETLLKRNPSERLPDCLIKAGLLTDTKGEAPNPLALSSLLTTTTGIAAAAAPRSGA
jgi:serine/threonine protein kinase